MDTLVMPQYHIHHATGVNRFREIDIQPRSYVGFVQAKSLQDAFVKSQTNFNKDWDTRSTSVGDVIQDNDGFHMVCGIGFKKLFGREEPPEYLQQ
jgi:hypothetical protein